MFSGQAQASLAFGIAISLAGIIGTPLGGWWLDHDVKRIWVSGANPTVMQLAAPRHTLTKRNTFEMPGD